MNRTIKIYIVFLIALMALIVVVDINPVLWHIELELGSNHVLHFVVTGIRVPGPPNTALSCGQATKCC